MQAGAMTTRIVEAGKEESATSEMLKQGYQRIKTQTLPDGSVKLTFRHAGKSLLSNPGIHFNGASL